MTKEATARIKINKLLEAAGWRFFADGNGAANIRLEPSVTIKSTDLDALGEIHGNYLSQKDIEICLAFDFESLAGKPGDENMRELHDVLRTKYGSDDASGAALSAALPPSRDSATGEDHAAHGSIDMHDSEAACAVMSPPNR